MSRDVEWVRGSPPARCIMFSTAGSCHVWVPVWIACDAAHVRMPQHEILSAPSCALGDGAT